MLLIWGRRFYGKIHQVPGTCYVATLFWHAFFFPMVPLGTYLVVEGSSKRLASTIPWPMVVELQYGFQGLRIPVSFFSIIMGYVRGILGLGFVVAGFGIFLPLIDPRGMQFGSSLHVAQFVEIVIFGCLFGLSRWLTRASRAKAQTLTAQLDPPAPTHAVSYVAQTSPASSRPPANPN